MNPLGLSRRGFLRAAGITTMSVAVPGLALIQAQVPTWAAFRAADGQARVRWSVPPSCNWGWKKADYTLPTTGRMGSKHFGKNGWVKPFLDIVERLHGTYEVTAHNRVIRASRPIGGIQYRQVSGPPGVVTVGPVDSFDHPHELSA